MRKIIASFFISLDGVVEAPETWHFPYFNDEMGAVVGGQLAESDTMLLGRNTWEGFAAYWPEQPEDGEMVKEMNGAAKLVVSTTLIRCQRVAELHPARGRHGRGIDRTEERAGQEHQRGRQRHAGPVTAAGEGTGRAAPAGPPDRGRARPAALRRGRDAAAGTGVQRHLQHRRPAHGLPGGLTWSALQIACCSDDDRAERGPGGHHRGSLESLGAPGGDPAVLRPRGPVRRPAAGRRRKAAIHPGRARAARRPAPAPADRDRTVRIPAVRDRLSATAV